MPPKGTNQIIKIEDGVVFMDVSTKAYPGFIALFDEIDLPLVLDGGRRWSTNKDHGTFYVVRRLDTGAGTRERLHRTILGLAGNALGDHRNGNGLDSRRENLRAATAQQNCRNGPSYGQTSQYRGVSWDRGNARWRASIGLNRRSIKLGTFHNELAAARAYDAAAIEHFGEFARLNFPGAQSC